jgi:hypothetical protein
VGAQHSPNTRTTLLHHVSYARRIIGDWAHTRHMPDGLHLLLEEGSQRGGFSSPASQPVASVFRGSTAKQTFSTRSQVLHSKVRSSYPRLPGEIRANPILCLQVGHIGRSTLDNELRITPPWSKRYSLHDPAVCPIYDSRARFCLS